MPERRKYTTLLADDVSALRKLIRIAVERSGRFDVIAEASTGTEAIQMARTSQPDLVLLDLSMPEMDGLEALPHILRASPRTHVVVLSGFNHVRMAPVAKRMGASAYLEKGLEPEALAQALLDVLEPASSSGDQTWSGGIGGPPGGAMPAETARGVDAAVALPAQVPYKILVIDADPQQAARVRDLLVASDAARFSPVVRASFGEAGEVLRRDDLDLALVATNALGPNADEGLIDLLTASMDRPVVVLAPNSESSFPAQAFKLGVEDCITETGLEAGVLGRSLLYAIERRRAQTARELMRSQQAELERLRRIDDLKAQFFNTAAHELGTPLTPMRLQIHLLKNMLPADASPSQRKAIEILDRNVDRLSRLTQDLLDVAKIQAGRLYVQPVPTEIARIVRDVAETFEPVAMSRGILFASDCRAHRPIEADAKRVVQVLINLTDNALKFTPRGGRVLIECSETDDGCMVRVRDTGVGLRLDQIERLFQPFSQVLGEAQPSGVGTGLGLFVSRGIVEAHGGRLWCESEGPGKGTTFAFTLPYAPRGDAAEVAGDAVKAQRVRVREH